MILPIVGYGHKALREKNLQVEPEHPALDSLIDNMFETMYNAQGVGLAAPQVGLSLRLFVVDGSPMADEEDEEDMKNFKMVFINPEMLKEAGDPWPFEEGCLSIPDIREKVTRKESIWIRYQTPEFETVEATFSGMKARIIQHEYDHLEGVLFVDHISAMRRRILKPRLVKLAKEGAQSGYPMKFPRQKR
ncbi:MAG: peptide deformylase [Bacteroidota bacterium]